MPPGTRKRLVNWSGDIAIGCGRSRQAREGSRLSAEPRCRCERPNSRKQTRPRNRPTAPDAAHAASRGGTMTDESRGLGGTVGPPWSVDVLADLHAGVLDDHEAAELWPLVNADPEARAILDALDATQSDLSSLAEAPAPPMPAEFAAR